MLLAKTIKLTVTFVSFFCYRPSQPYTGPSDIPNEDVPVIIMIPPGTTLSMKRCAGMYFQLIYTNI